MVNSEDFIKRLEFILDYYTLSASGFADKIGVQRSSLSHLLSGRNKPSLDFILKILEFFPEIDLYWILNGQGNFLKMKNEKNAPSPTPNFEEKILEKTFSTAKSFEKNTTQEAEKIISQEKKMLETNPNSIEKIVILYANGKFKEYNP
jgi:transcriptional regulator with XRE-family HTH domain